MSASKLQERPSSEEPPLKAETTAEAPSHSARIQTLGLYKSFGDNRVLSNINFEIAPGEFVAVVGRSGCGKSTLLRLLAGLETPTRGSVLVDEQPLLGPNKAARVMFQDARLMPWKTVLQNVGLGLSGDWKPQALAGLRAVGLEERQEDWTSILSGGQRQRVALARALAKFPRLMLLDEPLGALDALTRLEMQALLERVWQQRKFTALLITHDVEEAVALANRIVLIEQGQVVMNTTIGLPYPRDRASVEFIHLREKVLQRVLGGGSSQ